MLPNLLFDPYSDLRRERIEWNRQYNQWLRENGPRIEAARAARGK